MHHVTVAVRPPNRQAFTLVVDGRLELGREGDGIIVVDARVSRRHIALEPGPESTVIVTDLGSSNGTEVDGTPIEGPTTVAEGSIVRLGDTRVEVGRLRVGPRDQGSTEVSHDVRPRSSMDAVADAVVDDLQAHVEDVQAHVLAVEDEPGTLTIAFSDIESSTQLAVALGDARWFDVLQRHGRLVSAHVRAHHGRIVKHQGDGYMLCFRSARGGLLAAIGIQRDLAESTWCPPGQELRVRIGMHIGEVVVDDDGDLFGKHVVVAARIGALASGTEILVSSLVRQIAEARGDITFHAPRLVELRGIGDEEEVSAVDWTQGPSAEDL